MPNLFRPNFASGVRRSITWHLGVLILLAARSSTAEHVNVRGKTTLEAKLTRTAEFLTVVGVLRDDMGAPVKRGEVVVVPADALGQRIPPDSVSFDDCEPDPQLPLRPASKGSTLVFSAVERGVVGARRRETRTLTDDAGRFCAHLESAIAVSSIRVSFAGSAWLEGNSEREVSVSRDSKYTFVVDAVPEISLDRPAFHLNAKVLRSLDAARNLAPVSVRLSDERGTALGIARETEDGRIQFDFATGALAPAGLGSLTLVSEGNDAVSYRLNVMRRCQVAIEAPSIHPLSRWEEGAEVRALVVCGSHPVNEGWVEARLGDRSLTTSPVANGRVSLSAQFHIPSDGVHLQLAYVSPSPWMAPGTPLGILVFAPRADRLSWIALPTMFGAIIVWILLRRWDLSLPRQWRRVRAVVTEIGQARSLSRSSGDSTGEMTTSTDTAEEPVISGQLVDAHDGNPIAGARVTMQPMVFPDATGSAGSTQTVQTDTEGHFRFNLDNVPATTTLRVHFETAHHKSVEVDAPTLRRARLVRLVTRKRHLLDQFLLWARQRGYHQEMDPTPSTMGAFRTRHALERDDAPNGETGHWLREIELAVFSPGPVDASVEAQIDTLQPKGGDPGSLDGST